MTAPAANDAPIESTEAVQPTEEAPGHEALRMWFEAEKSRTYAGMARVLDVSAATVGGWCRLGNPVRPREVAHMFAIEVMTGIPPHAWLLPSETRWLYDMSQGKFVAVFERPKRAQPVDDRQMAFDQFWQPNAPQPDAAAAVFDPDALMG